MRQQKVMIVTRYTAMLVDGHDTKKGLDALEADYIEWVYSLARYNQVRAAKMLDIPC